MTTPANLTPGQTVRSMGQDVYVVSVETRDDAERPFVVTTEQFPASAPENYSKWYVQATHEFRH